MASAAVSWDSLREEFDWSESEKRSDEDAVRILLIEDRPQFAPVVCWALDHAPRGHFDVEQTTALVHARRLLRFDVFDAVVVDLGDRSGDRALEAMDAAEALAHQVPVIVLKGTCFEGLEPVSREDQLADLVARKHLACDRLPCAILDAIHRHRRVGQGGATPIVYRIHD